MSTSQHLLLSANKALCKHFKTILTKPSSSSRYNNMLQKSTTHHDKLILFEVSETSCNMFYDFIFQLHFVSQTTQMAINAVYIT